MARRRPPRPEQVVGLVVVVEVDPSTSVLGEQSAVNRDAQVRFESQSADVAAGDVRAFAVKRPELGLHLWMKRGDDGAHLRTSFLHRS